MTQRRSRKTLAQPAQAVIYYPVFSRWDEQENATIVAVGNSVLARTMQARTVMKLGRLYERCIAPLRIELDAKWGKLCISQTVPDPSPRKIEACATSLRAAFQRVGIKAITSPSSLPEIEKLQRSPI